MADYPSYTQRVGTVRTAMAGIKVARAVSGKPYFTNYFSQTWYEFTVQHECNVTAMQFLLTHYRVHRMLEFDFTFQADSSTYKAQYAAKPVYNPIPGTDRWLVEAKLVGTGSLPFGVVKVSHVATVTATGEIRSRRQTATMTASSTVTVTDAPGHQQTVAVASGVTALVQQKKGATGSATCSCTASVDVIGTKLS